MASKPAASPDSTYARTVTEPVCAAPIATLRAFPPEVVATVVGLTVFVVVPVTAWPPETVAVTVSFAVSIPAISQ